MKPREEWEDLSGDWEEVVLQYAIDTFPYSDAFEYLPGYEGNDREVLSNLIDSGLLKIGFYYEELQEGLTIFYFLEVEEENYIVLGLDAAIRVEIPIDVDGIFRLDDEQYIDLLQIQIN